MKRNQYKSGINKRGMLLLFVFAVLTLNPINSPGAWQPVGAPQGGQIAQILNQNDSIYALAPGSGIYLSKNDGGNWNQITKGNSWLNLTAYFAIESNMIYAATYLHGIFRSSDNGNSWTQINFGIPDTLNLTVNKIIKIKSILFLCTNEGLFSSTDMGDKWVQQNQGLINPNVYDLIELNNTMYLGSQNNIYISNDMGSTWIPSFFRINIAYKLFVINNEIHACIVDSTGNYEIVASTDRGNNWTPYHSADFRNFQILDIAQISSRIGLNIVKKTGNTYQSRVYYSIDDGGKWPLIYDRTADYTPDLWYGLALTNNFIFLGTRFDGIKIIDDIGANQPSSNKGLYNIQITSLAFKNSDIYAGTAENGVYFSGNNGSSWSRIDSSPHFNSGQYKRVNKIIINRGNILAAVNPGLYQSKNEGQSWFDMGLANFNIVDFVIEGDSIFAIGNDISKGNLIYSNNYGVNWNPQQPYSSLFAGMLKINQNILIGYNSNNPNDPKDGVIQTADNGKTWSLVGQPVLDGINLFSIVKSGTKILRSSKSGVYQLNDIGTSWVASNQGIKTENINSMFAFGNFVFSATENGAFISENHGDNWSAINSGLRNFDLYGYSNKGNTIYAILNGDEIYKSDFESFFPINIAGIPSNILCSGMEFVINYSFDKSYTFDTSNVFKVVLSDAEGNFESGTNIIGFLRSYNPGTIRVTIPKGLAYGTKYRIRVVSTSPALNGSDNLNDLTILNRTNPVISGAKSVCAGTTSTYSVGINPGYTYKWIVSGGTISGPDNSTNVNINWMIPGTGNLRVLQENIAECSDSSEIAIQVYPVLLTPTITQIDSTLISSADTGNQWYLNGNPLPGDTAKNLKTKTKGTYTVQVTDRFGCSSQISAQYYYESPDDIITFIIDDAAGDPGKIVNIKIRLIKNKNFSKMNISSISAVFVVDESVLYPIDIGLGALTAEKRYIPIIIDTTYITSNIVEAMNFRAMLGDAVTSQMTLENIRINNTDTIKVIAEPGTFTLTGICTEGGPRLIASGSGAKIISVNPNPANDLLNVDFETIESGITGLYIVSPLGVNIKSLFKNEIEPGKYSRIFSLEGIMAGSYYLVMDTPSQRKVTGLIITR